MKKYYSILLIAALALSLCACSKTPSDSNNNTTPPEVEEPTIKLEEVKEEEGVQLFDENLQQYTADTLPDGYDRKDFDGDGLNNKDEIAAGTDMYVIDTDGDGLGDRDEIYETKTDPLKWSSRDDDMSDLEWSIVNAEFEEGYTATDAYGFKMYLTNPEDRLYIISKVKTDVFNDLETISEPFTVKNFSGKMALNVNKYIDEVANSISVYKIQNNQPVKIDSKVDENRLVEFEIQENDVFVLVYSGNEGEN